MLGTVGFCSTVSEDRKSGVGSDARVQQAEDGPLTSKQLGHRPEPEFFTLEEHRADVQAAVPLCAELIQGQDVLADLAMAEI